MSSCKVAVIIIIIIVGIWRNLNFLGRFSKNTQISNFIYIRPVGTELFRATGQTDRQTDIHEEANSRFS